MKHTRSSLLGALAGLAVGVALIPTPLGALFVTTPVTWDGSACTAGTYTITSTATNLATSQTYVVTTSNVVLPRPAVVQNFQNLAAGMYTVSASLRTVGGEPFPPAFQTLTVQDDNAPTAPAPDASATSRRRPPAAPVIGVAQPRQTPLPKDGYAAEPRRKTMETMPTVAPDPASPAAASAHAVLIESLLSLLAKDSTTTLPGGVGLKILDADGDGIADLVGVTIAGEVWILRIRRY